MYDKAATQGVAPDEKAEPHGVAICKRKLYQSDSGAETERRRDDNPFLRLAVRTFYDAPVGDRHPAEDLRLASATLRVQIKFHMRRTIEENLADAIGVNGACLGARVDLSFDALDAKLRQARPFPPADINWCADDAARALSLMCALRYGARVRAF